MIDTILPPKVLQTWERVTPDSNIAFVELHRMFWTQVAREEFSDPDEPEHKGDDDDDDDIGPNCGVFDIGVSVLGVKTIWIRNEYIRIFKYCEDYILANVEKSKSPAVIITGQPGIGKSYWIFYALCRLLAKKQPVQLYHDEHLYLFVAEGVYRSPQDFDSSLFTARVWTLVDADNSKSFPGSLSPLGTMCINVFVTSPKEDRWSLLLKTTNWSFVYMNPWTREEILKAAPIHGAAGKETDIEDLYDRYGPTPRICFDLLDNDNRLAMYDSRLHSALLSLSSKTLRKLADGRYKDDEGGISHTILLVKRIPGPNLARRTMDIITPNIAMAVRDQLRKETDMQRFERYQDLMSIEVSKPLAGVPYELLCQEKLWRQDPMTLELFRMQRKPAEGRQKYARWHSMHRGELSPLSITIEREGFNSFEVKPNQIQEKVYYIPGKQNHVAFDSFIIDNNRLFIFQFTVSEEHDIKEGILTFFSQSSLPPENNWYFIFVIPPESKALVCREKDKMKFLARINFYSMVLNPQPEP